MKSLRLKGGSREFIEIVGQFSVISQEKKCLHCLDWGNNSCSPKLNIWNLKMMVAKFVICFFPKGGDSGVIFSFHLKNLGLLE